MCDDKRPEEEEVRESNVDGMLEEFRERRSLYLDFGRVVEGLLRSLLSKHRLRAQSINHRVKDTDRLREKLTRAGKSYRRLSQVTDLLGVRIIAYFVEDVEKIASLIRREFDVDEQNSVDRGKQLAPDQFGYNSQSIVCRISRGRLQLDEYSDYKGLMCEIQLPTVLQHAWAEIEHDRGYKTNVAVPNAFKRRFAILAAQLESADREFSRLDSEIETYQKEVEREMQTQQYSQPLDFETLAAYLYESPLVREIANEICPSRFVAHPPAVIRNTPAAGTLNFRLLQLQAAGINDIATLDRLLGEYRQRMVKLEKKLEKRHGRPRHFVDAHWIVRQVLVAMLASQDASADVLIDRMNEVLYGRRPIYEPADIEEMRAAMV